MVVAECGWLNIGLPYLLDNGYKVRCENNKGDNGHENADRLSLGLAHLDSPEILNGLDKEKNVVVFVIVCGSS